MADLITADLIELAKSGEWVVGHGCNCCKVMGAGVARLLADAFPVVAIADREWDHPGFGNIMPVPLTNGGYVINCYTQIYPGHPNTTNDTVEARLAAIKSSLLALSGLFPRKRNIAIPKIGCGLAGLSWTDVEPLIPENITVCQI